MSDAFQRVVRGAAKLEPELLDELGIFTRIDPAVRKYADRSEEVKLWHHALSTRCPTSISVIHRLLFDMPPADSMTEALQMDFQIACKMMRRSDFSEGVRAILIDKDNSPVWSPDNLSLITKTELEAIFEFDSSLSLNTTL